jgi:type IX secretion system substrate protein
MNKLLIILITLITINSAEGQSLTPTALVSSGNYYSNSGYSLSQTLGESINYSVYSGGLTLSHGEQQPPSALLLLPLKWLEVSGNLNTVNHAVIKWKVEETDVINYSVEKKKDNITFQSICILKSAGNGLHEYSFTEPIGLNGEAIYRIVQKDWDGHFTYSSELHLRSDLIGTATIYPNPAETKVTVCVTDNSLIHSQANLIDMHGHLLKAVTLETFTQIDLNPYPRGMYLLMLQNGKSFSIIKH